MRMMKQKPSVESAMEAPSAARRRLQAGLDALFLVLYGLYVLYRTSRTTQLSVPYPKQTPDALLAALAVAALLRALCLGLKRRDVWVAFAMAGLCRLCYGVGGYALLNFIAVSVIGFVGMDCRKALWTHILAAGSVLVVAVTAALTCSIENIVFYRDGLRSCWGICYPTDFSTYTLFLAIALWVAWDRLPDWGMLLLALIPESVALFVTKSRNGLICGTLFLCAIAYLIFERRVIDGHPSLRRIRRGVDGLLVSAFWLCAGATWLLVWLYARNIPGSARLDDMMSGRLSISLNSLRTYGVRMLGAKFSQVGNGFSTIPRLNVSFIDSSFVLLPLRYGWLMSLSLGALWTWLTARAIRDGRRRLALALALIAFHSIMEHHFIEQHYNAFLVLPFVALGDSAPAEARSGRRGVAASAVALALSATALWLALPRAFPRLRTAFDALGWKGGGAATLPAAAVILLCALTVAAGARAAFLLTDAALSRRAPSRRAIPLLLLCAVVAVGGYAWTERAVEGALSADDALLNEERKAMKTIVGAATGGVYVNDQPITYARQFGGVRRTMLAGEDLASYTGSTALMDANTDYYVFFQCGWQYARISDAHSVYTSDPAVIEALSAKGYGLTSYWTGTMEVDLEAEAKSNHLKYNRYGMLVKSKKPLKKGPRKDLFAGSYVVRYALRLPETVARAIDEAGGDALVCTLRVYGYAGKLLLAEAPVYRSQFDAKRRLTVEVPFQTIGVHSADYLASAEDGMQVYISEITCQKVG